MVVEAHVIFELKHYLLGNCFSGEIPEELENITTLTYFTSHFKVVIKRLRWAHPQEYDEDDQMNLIGEDDEEGFSTHDINSTIINMVCITLFFQKDMEPDVTVVESPTKSHDSEDELYRWRQYKNHIGHVSLGSVMPSATINSDYR
nr:hypothetical protein [Tanacetum cinerariifolium]